MSKKVVIFPLSLLSQQDDMAAVQRFRQYGLDLPSLLWSLRPGGALKSTIHSYRLGYLTTPEFREAVREIFPKLNVSNEEFDSAWQSRLKLIESAENYFQMFAKLQAEGHQVILVSATNELDFQFHQQQFSSLLLGNEPRYLLSYQSHVVGDDLLKLAYEQIKAEGIEAVDIVQVMSEPTPPQALQGLDCLNPLAWTVYLIEEVFFQQKHNVYQGLQVLAENEGVTILGWSVDKMVDELLISLEETINADGGDSVMLGSPPQFDSGSLMSDIFSQKSHPLPQKVCWLNEFSPQESVFVDQ